MTVKILLVAAVDAEVMVDGIIRRAVIVVEATAVRRVVRDDEIVVDIIEGRRRGGLARGDVGDVRETIPRVERAVVAGLAAGVEEQVVPATRRGGSWGG